MGGGVFSPSLMVGALLGLSYGIIATSFVPSMSGSVSLYALAGMAAVAAAVLGAPISTTLIVFERTRAAYLPVVKVGGETAPSQIVGRLHEVDALRAYNKALSDAAEEEHS